jgi:hypothetical protein
MPGRLAAQAEFLDRNPGVVLLGTHFQVIDDSGRVRATTNHAESPAVLAFLLNFTNSLGVPGQGMFRATTAREAGGFSHEVRFAQGYELWARLARRGAVAVLPIVGLRYRVHDRSATAVHRDEQTKTAIWISRRELSQTIGRELTDQEAEAVYLRWSGLPRRGVSGLAERVIGEAFEAFRRTSPADADLRRVQVLVANRFARSAASLAKRARLREAMQCARIAARWHPGGFRGVAREAMSKLFASDSG